MRFDLLLAQYLYKNKKLNLPGIGRFEADSSVYAPEDNEKQKSSLEGITFHETTVSKADEDLIDFIKDQTGKMKPLAVSDLESYLTLGKQFLFIGKPFYLEGIGTLQLAKSGHFEFIPGEYITTKLEDPNIERSEGKKRSVHEEDRMLQESNTNNIKILFLFLGIVGALTLVAWGGYHLYNMNLTEQTALEANSLKPQEDSTYSLLSTDSINELVGDQPYSTSASEVPIPLPPGINEYKFIVEITQDKLRAYNRYKDLRSYGNKIEIETADSVNYKLFYSIRTTSSDTLRIRDSLNRWYYRNDDIMRVTIE
ncbi:MAG: hypothetical protein WKF89_14685 [Chitinophagaceae bacterium]